MNKLIYFLLIGVIGMPMISYSQISINEVQNRNRDCYPDKDSEYPDWIELYNAGTSAVNLQGYYLSDDLLNPNKWQFPSANINAKSYLIVYASGKGVSSIGKPVDHWESAVLAENTWKYLRGTAEPPTTWKSISFNDAAWLSGQGGIGYTDGDDKTIIATSTRSVYMRKTFTIADTSKIGAAIFSMDYDDGFVAYLNGVEIARKNMEFSTYDAFATTDHEATMYTGGNPESFTLSYALLKALLVNGTNVLCVQTHNVSATSSDLSSIPFLSFGLTDNGTYFSPTPAWFTGITSTAAQLHTNFKLDKDGETIVLTNTAGVAINTAIIPALLPDHSYCRIPDGTATWCISDTASPAKTNNNLTCYLGYAATPVISPKAGFYLTKPTISITATAGDTIRYTTNGDIPTRKSPIYKNTFSFDTTHVVRAKAFNQKKYLPSETATTTFVIAQNTDLPIMSISTDSLNLWDWNTGIYVGGPGETPGQPGYGANYWEDWERECHMEYFDKGKVQQINMNGLIKIHGGWTRWFPKKGMVLKVDKYLPNSSLNYKFYDDKNVTDYRSIVVRAQGQDNNEAHCRDALMNQSLKNTNCDFIDFSPCVLYLNGAYWGIYELRELTNETYAENNYGVNRDSVDVIFGNASVVEGSDLEYNKTYDFITGNSMASTTNFNVAKTMIDLDNMCDWFIAQTYYANRDWVGDWVGNTKLWREQTPTGKWRYVYYDMDMGLAYGMQHTYETNKLSEGLNPKAESYNSNMFRALLNNTSYKQYFINRYADLMNTIFLPDSLNKLVDRFYNLYKNEMPRDWAKWYSESTKDWDYYMNVIRTYVNQRPTFARTHIQQQFTLSGQTTVNLNVASNKNAGRIKISTIYPTPYPWQGIYFRGIPVKLSAIENPGFTFVSWTINDGNSTTTQTTRDITLTFTTSSITITANFSGNATATGLTISEINYHSDKTHDAGDWFELHNTGNAAINLSDWFLRDTIYYNRFKFPVGTKIQANGYLVVCEDSLLFKSVYPNVKNIIGNMPFNLSNNGESIQLFDKDFKRILSLNYNDSVAWLKCTDGHGRTMELESTASDINDPENWFAGCMFGSPGTANATCSNQGVIFHEINYRSSATFDAGDWIELFNTGDAAVDISGWVFKDDNDLQMFTIPANTSIGAKSYLVLYANQLLFTARHPSVTNATGAFAFGLSASDDVLRLYDKNGKLHTAVNYYDQLPFPLTADGLGYTIELIDTLGRLCDGTNWQAICLNGSPGTSCKVTSIDESSIISGASLYPVPAKDRLYLTYANEHEQTISIHSMIGTCVYTGLLRAGTQTQAIALQGFNSGMYTMVMTDALTHERTIMRFVKE